MVVANKTFSKQRTKGIPATEWAELKKNFTRRMTPTGIDGMKTSAKELGISTAELLERLARIDWSQHKDLLNSIEGVTKLE